MRQLHAYERQDGGTLAPTELVMDDGGQVMTPRGFALQPTGRTETLTGWGSSDGARPVYVNDGGREYIVIL